MNEHLWAELGIAPTRELAAIKKAYALKLRVTRPDDDAAAYQRLRTAYEWAQQWAKWAREEETEAAVESAPQWPEEVAASPEARPEEMNDLHSVIGHDDLADWVRRLGAEGADAQQIMAAWTEIRPQLYAIPLHLQAEASARFGDLVIEAPLLPISIVQTLEQTFGWRDDFRIARQLGAQRLQALREALDERLARTITDPEKLRRFAPLLYLQQLRRQSRDMAAFWFALRVGDPLLQLLLVPEARKVRTSGLAGETAPISSGWLVFWAGVVRGMPLTFLLALWLQPQLVRAFLDDSGPHILGDHPLLIVLKLLFVSAAPVVVTLAGLCVLASVRILAVCVQVLAWSPHWPKPFVHPLRVRFGLPLLAASALLLSLEISVPYLGIATSILGMLLAWPREPGHAAVALAALLALGLSAIGSGLHFEAASPVLYWLPLWVLAGCWAHARGPEAHWSGIFFRPITNSLNLADHHGYKLAITPALIAACVALSIEDARGTTVFAIWACSILALGWLQNVLIKSAYQEMG